MILLKELGYERRVLGERHAPLYKNCPLSRDNPHTDVLFLHNVLLDFGEERISVTFCSMFSLFTLCVDNKSPKLYGTCW